MRENIISSIIHFYKALGIDIFFTSLCDKNLLQYTKALTSNKESLKHSIVKEYNKEVIINNCNKESLVNQYNTTNNDKYSNNQPLFQLLQEINNIDCLIKQTARSTVVFDGEINSKIMIIGEAPGQEEDLQGKPFVGQSGILLNNMLKAIGLSREDTIISNIVFWRPPFNRTPSTEEISLCLPYVKKLIQIINPRVLLLLGAISNHALLNNNLPMSRLRGTVNNVLGIKAVSIYHPAYLLRSSNQKKYAFKDFLLLKNIINI